MVLPKLNLTNNIINTILLVINLIAFVMVVMGYTMTFSDTQNRLIYDLCNINIRSGMVLSMKIGLFFCVFFCILLL